MTCDLASQSTGRNKDKHTLSTEEHTTILNSCSQLLKAQFHCYTALFISTGRSYAYMCVGGGGGVYGCDRVGRDYQYEMLPYVHVVRTSCSALSVLSVPSVQSRMMALAVNWWRV